MSKRSTIEKIKYWQANGEVGCSSETMALTAKFALEGRENQGQNYYPYDADDLKRCIKLVEAVPEIKDHFPVIAKLSRQWRNVVENWESLVQSAYNEFGKPLGSKHTPKVARPSEYRTSQLMLKLGIRPEIKP